MYKGVVHEFVVFLKERDVSVLLHSKRPVFVTLCTCTVVFSFVDETSHFYTRLLIILQEIT